MHFRSFITSAGSSHDSRLSPEQLRDLSERTLSDPIVGVIFESIGGYAMVIDERRQILAANAELLELLGARTGASVLGLRPGEALSCVNASREEAGCGASDQCRHCGALAALLAAHVSEGVAVEGQCVVTRKPDSNGKSPTSRDFRMRITPLMLGTERVYVLVMHDITAVKWRELQERVFQHDLANVLAGLSGWTGELQQASSAEAASEIVALVDRLNESLQVHRLIMKSENGDMQIIRAPLELRWIVSNLHTMFAEHEVALQRTLTIEVPEGSWPLYTDGTLLLRVLANLVKNALEASAVHGVVTVRITSTQAETTFHVHNGGTIDASVAKQLFKRRVSTNGPARGLGMYSIQVLGEHLLGGVVRFETDEVHGTVFSYTLSNQA